MLEAGMACVKIGFTNAIFCCWQHIQAMSCVKRCFTRMYASLCYLPCSMACGKSCSTHIMLCFCMLQARMLRGKTQFTHVFLNWCNPKALISCVKRQSIHVKKLCRRGKAVRKETATGNQCFNSQPNTCPFSFCKLQKYVVAGSAPVGITSEVSPASYF